MVLGLLIICKVILDCGCIMYNENSVRHVDVIRLGFPVPNKPLKMLAHLRVGFDFAYVRSPHPLPNGNNTASV